MRIVQLVKRRQRRGAEVFAAELSDALVDRGHEVLFVGLGVPEHDDLRPAAAACEDLGRRLGGALEFDSAWRLAARLRAYAPDIVQANGSDTLKYSVVARGMARGRWTIVYRNIGLPSDWIRGRLHRAANRILVSRVDHVVSVSRASALDFSKTYRYPAERIEVIAQSAVVPEAVDRDSLRDRLLSVANLAKGAEVILHVGSFTPEKNHAWLVEAFDEIVRERPAAVLVLIGDGPEKEPVEEIVRRSGVADRIRLLGTRADAADLAGGADVFVLPSLTEGIPAVLLEAGARGVPSVATSVGGVPEVIRDGVTGILVEPGDRAAFVTGVCRLLSDVGLRAGFGVAAREQVQRCFSLDGAVLAYMARYESLLGVGSSEGPSNPSSMAMEIGLA